MIPRRRAARSSGYHRSLRFVRGMCTVTPNPNDVLPGEDRLAQLGDPRAQRKLAQSSQIRQLRPVRSLEAHHRARGTRLEFGPFGGFDHDADLDGNVVARLDAESFERCERCAAPAQDSRQGAQRISLKTAIKAAGIHGVPRDHSLDTAARTARS